VGQANLTLSLPTTKDIIEGRLSHQERSGEDLTMWNAFREC
jgi:hypothetical protein